MVQGTSMSTIWLDVTRLSLRDSSRWKLLDGASGTIKASMPLMHRDAILFLQCVVLIRCQCLEKVGNSKEAGPQYLPFDVSGNMKGRLCHCSGRMTLKRIKKDKSVTVTKIPAIWQCSWSTKLLLWFLPLAQLQFVQNQLTYQVRILMFTLLFEALKLVSTNTRVFLFLSSEITMFWTDKNKCSELSVILHHIKRLLKMYLKD